MLSSIVLSYTSPFTARDFAEFGRLFEESGTHIELDEREPPGPQAGIEWLLVTGAFVYIGKSYFDGILKEMGKEHYHVLKGACKTLYGRLIGPRAPAMTVISTAGKMSPKRKYSLLFSLLAEAEDGLRFKLLIQQSATEAEYEAAVNAFLDFLDAFHRSSLSREVIAEMRQTPVVGKTMLLAFSKEFGRIVPIDPLQK